MNAEIEHASPHGKNPGEKSPENGRSWARGLREPTSARTFRGRLCPATHVRQYRRCARRQEMRRSTALEGIAAPAVSRDVVSQALDRRSTVTELPRVLDGGAACGVIEYAPYVLGGRKPPDVRS